MNQTTAVKPVEAQFAEISNNSMLASYAVVLGRALFSAIFITASFNHFARSTIDYAAQQGVPLPHVAVPFSGILALLGGLSILLGYRARIGALLLMIFLIPVTFMMHNYWTISDPMMHQIQMAMFMKNLSMLGGAILIFNFGSGPLSAKKG